MDLSRYKVDYHKIWDNNKSVYFVETENFRQVVVGIKTLHTSKIPGAFLKTAGCGISYASKIYAKENSRNAFYYSTKYPLKHLLQDLLFKLGYDFRPYYKYDNVPDKFMIKGLKYHFGKVESKDPCIVVLDDIQYLKGFKLIQYINFIEATKTVLNFCLITTERFMERHASKANNNATSQEITDLIVDWKPIEEVLFEEKCQICFLFGLRDQKLIDRLADESKNLKDLYKTLNRIKRIAKEQISFKGKNDNE